MLNILDMFFFMQVSLKNKKIFGKWTKTTLFTKKLF